MSNPWAKSFEDLRAPYLSEKKAKKDYDGDGKIESGAKEYRGVVHNKIQKAKGGKADGQDTSSVKEHHQKDENGKVIEHEVEDTTPSSVEEDVVLESLKQARKNIGMDPDKPSCWKGYKAKGTKMKGGKSVPNCVPKSESYTVTNADKVGNTPAYQGLVKGKLNVKTGKPLYKAAGHLKLDKAHYDWKEDLHWEALKRDKLDIKETGVKNKIEINPTVKTEAAKAPVKK